MAKISEKTLNINDYPEEYKELLSPLFYNLDQFKKSVEAAFRNRLNFRENSDSFIRLVDDLMLSDITNENVTVVPDTRELPCDIMATVIKQDLTRLTVPVEWRVNDDGSVTIIALDTTRLSSDDKFSLQLTIFGR